jgi:hypothetical protein
MQYDMWNLINERNGANNVGHVSKFDKNQLIDNAKDTWEAMGLFEEQIAFGIAMMGIESGFNPKASRTDHIPVKVNGVIQTDENGNVIYNDYVYKGLGQFAYTIPNTWGDAVDLSLVSG